MLLDHYVSAMPCWKGRVDSDSDYDAFRWHQWVQPLDLNDGGGAGVGPPRFFIATNRRPWPQTDADTCRSRLPEALQEAKAATARPMGGSDAGKRGEAWVTTGMDIRAERRIQIDACG